MKFLNNVIRLTLALLFSLSMYLRSGYAAEFIQKRKILPKVNETVMYSLMNVNDTWIFELEAETHRAVVSRPTRGSWSSSLAGNNDHGRRDIGLNCGNFLRFWKKRLPAELPSDSFATVITGTNVTRCGSTNGTTGVNSTQGVDTVNSFLYTLENTGLEITPSQSTIVKGQWLQLNSLNIDLETPENVKWKFSPVSCDLYESQSSQSNKLTALSPSVNVAFFISNTPGTYTISTLKNIGDPANSGGVAVVTVLSDLVLDNNIWWSGLDSDGRTPLTVQLYPNVTRLSAPGLNNGDFQWLVTNGDDKINLMSSDSIAPGVVVANYIHKTNSNEIWVIAKNGSDVQNDITIELTHNNVIYANVSLSVRKPSILQYWDTEHKNINETVFLIDVKGYESVFTYFLKDQFGALMPHYPIGEYFPDAWKEEFPDNNWGEVDRIFSGCHTDGMGSLADSLSMKGPFSMYPKVLNKQNPLGSILVRTITQHIRAGKATGAISDINAGLP